MNTTQRVSVVIPCFNEEDTVEKVIRAVPNGVHEIIVVDNNSTDRTGEIARGLGVRVVPELTQGYGAALKAGFAAAQGDIIATLDGDGQYPAEKIFEIVRHLHENNLHFISANRFPLLDPSSLPRVRVIGNALFTTATNVLFLCSIKDSQSGMWVFRRELLPHILSKSDGMPFSQEFKIRALKRPNVRFAEYHITYRPRGGYSKLVPWKHGLINLGALLKLRLMLW